ncbi:MAG: ABC transporter permease, partial [Planctomycetales bacterium]|nr:ABC transporter permease [Planctomycetales bacterium]
VTMQLLWNGLKDAVFLLIAADPLVISAAWRSLWISVTAVAVASVAGITLGSGLARRSFVGKRLVLLFFRVGMSLPTVLIGLLCYAMFSRRGPLGGLDLLYTPVGIIAGEFCLALPLVVTWTHNALVCLDPRVAETAMTLGAGTWRRWMTYLREARASVVLALLTAFSRCITELGIAMMVGGNIKYRTRTLTTATALETARGEFSRGVAMSLILLLVALLVALVAAWWSRPGEDS